MFLVSLLECQDYIKEEGWNGLTKRLTLCSRPGFHIGKLVRLSYSTSPDCLINNDSCYMCLVSLLERQDYIKEDGWNGLERG